MQSIRLSVRVDGESHARAALSLACLVVFCTVLAQRPQAAAAAISVLGVLGALAALALAYVPDLRARPADPARPLAVGLAGVLVMATLAGMGGSPAAPARPGIAGASPSRPATTQARPTATAVRPAATATRTPSADPGAPTAALRLFNSKLTVAWGYELKEAGVLTLSGKRSEFTNEVHVVGDNFNIISTYDGVTREYRHVAGVDYVRDGPGGWRIDEMDPLQGAFLGRLWAVVGGVDSMTFSRWADGNRNLLWYTVKPVGTFGTRLGAHRLEGKIDLMEISLAPDGTPNNLDYTVSGTSSGEPFALDCKGTLRVGLESVFAPVLGR